VPGDKRTDVDGDGVLEWSQGDGAVQHDVYLGTDFDSVNNADTSDTTGIYRGRVGVNNFSPTGLQSDTVYYWRIDEVDSGQTITEGDVWDFKVRMSQIVRDLYSDTWVATDALGRELSGFDQCGGLRENRTVGIYYNTTIKRMPPLGPHNNTEIIAANPQNPDFAYAEPLFYWAEPEANYYLADDEWAIRRNLSMLTDAGVDVLILEATNGPTYIYETLVVCEVLQRMKDEGFETSLKMCIWSHANSPSVITTYYEQIYALNLYPDLWFHWEGKPLMLGYPDGISSDVPREAISQEIRNFFTWRTCWYDVSGSLHHEWQWGDLSPQNYGWDESFYMAEEVPISPAAHPTGNIGKSNSGGVQPPNNEYDLPVAGTEGHGIRFAEQWERALEVDPEFIFISEWNEWLHGWFIRTAETGPINFVGRDIPIGGYYAVDLYNMEYTRDIEPMRDGYTGNYYWQMIDGIRRYKGVRPPRTTSKAKTISIDGDFSDWTDVDPEFRDTIGDTFHRDSYGYCKAGPYTNTTGRNDLLDMKVARDDDYVYFYAKTRDDITSYTDPAWMLLYIDADQNHSTGWEGYDYVVNRSVNSATSTTLQSSYDGNLNSNLAAWWKLDDGSGTTAADSSSNNHHGTLINSPYFHPSFGRLDGTLRLDGIDDYVSLPNVFNPAQTPFTISAWVRLNTKLGTNTQSIFQQEGTNGRGLLYRDAATDRLGCYLGGVGTYSGTAVFATTDQWHHVCMTYDGAMVKLYVNGAEDGSRTVAAESETSEFRLGGHKAPSSALDYWDGFIDEVRIYERALSASEVLMLAGGVMATDGRGMVNSNIAYHVSGNEMELRIPRSDIGQGSGSDPVAFDFHWADNMQNPYYIIEFAVSGDSAPNRRFNYRYDTTVSDKACQRIFDDGNGNNMDLDMDCDLDIDDLALFADDWLAPHDLIDFAGLADDWLDDYLPTSLPEATILLEDNFETGVFSTNWAHSGNQYWSVTTDNPYQGAYSAKSGNITHNQQTHLSLDVTVTSDAILSFRYRVSSESCCDRLRFFINADEKITLAGNQPWMRATYTLTPGTYTLKWSYAKDGSVSSPDDCVWIDDILITATE